MGKSTTVMTCLWSTPVVIWSWLWGADRGLVVDVTPIDSATRGHSKMPVVSG